MLIHLLFPSFLSDPKRLADSGVGEREVLEGQEASGAVLRPHQRAAAAPAAAASYPTEGGLRGSGGLLSSPTWLFDFFSVFYDKLVQLPQFHRKPASCFS